MPWTFVRRLRRLRLYEHGSLRPSPRRLFEMTEASQPPASLNPNGVSIARRVATPTEPIWVSDDSDARGPAMPAFRRLSSPAKPRPVWLRLTNSGRRRTQYCSKSDRLHGSRRMHLYARQALSRTWSADEDRPSQSFGWQPVLCDSNLLPVLAGCRPSTGNCQLPSDFAHYRSK